jgi:HK97 family phage major capsid protein/HK97 family phage prohead protease
MMLRLDAKAAVTVSEEGQIEGLAAVFGTMDRGGDVLHKGAFAGAKFPMPMLASHDPADVVGVWESGLETGEGLQVKGRLILSVQRAREVRDLILAKAIEGLSIGYRTLKKAARSNGVRDLLSVELMEISVVAVPMHPGARITSAKGAGHETQEETMEKEELLAAAETKAAAVVAAGLADAMKPLLTRLDAIEAKGNRAKGGGDDGKQPTEERKAFSAYLQRGPLAADEVKLLSVSSDPNGGYLVPPEFSAEIIRDLVIMSPLRQFASVRGTSAPSVIYPTRKPMGNATWDDETTAEPETTGTAIFGQLEVMLKGMSTFIDIPNNLLSDAPAVEAEVRGATAEDFTKKEAFAFVKGDGVMQPEGLMRNPDIATHNYGATAFAATDPAAPLITMFYKLPATYRTAGAWAMNGVTLGRIRNWTDANGLKLWQPSLQLGQPETFLGRPVIEMPDMDDVAANAHPIIYGNFDGYRILDRSSLSVLVDPYSQATLKRTRYHMGRRVGGRVIMPAKFIKLKMSA